MNHKEHWENVYNFKNESEVSWYQADPSLSMNLILALCPHRGKVIDVGGGASVLVDRLLAEGFEQPAVLDISETALAKAKQRLGPASQGVQWIVADVTQATDIGQFDVWHDRAVFHFLTKPSDRAAYIALLSRTVPEGGHAVIATFALDGPEKCSGLPIQRYDSPLLSVELGAGFHLCKSAAETHVTPQGKTQSFQYSVFKKADVVR